MNDEPEEKTPTILSDAATTRNRVGELERLVALQDDWLRILYARVGIPHPGNEPRPWWASPTREMSRGPGECANPGARP